MTKLPHRVVFFGTPEFAVPILAALARAAEVVLVVSQPDKPSGRGCKVCKPPVKVCAETLGIEVIQPEIAKGRRFAARIAAYRPDFLITAAYGRILGKSVLEVPEKCALNVHASLLPKYRGAAPAAWAVLNGDTRSGVCIMQMVEALDAGPIFYREVLEVDPDETAGELLGRLSSLGAAAAVAALSRFDALEPSPQDESAASYARMLTKHDGMIDWSREARSLHNHVRGMSPWPSAFTCVHGENVKIHTARVLYDSGRRGAPGEVLAATKDGIDVACGEGVLRLLCLQAPGRKRLPVHTYLLGNPVQIGTVLGGAI